MSVHALNLLGGDHHLDWISHEALHSGEPAGEPGTARQPRTAKAARADLHSTEPAGEPGTTEGTEAGGSGRTAGHARHSGAARTTTLREG
jgi:hypothetical protein